jgi:phospholipid/cholesterol/gamma-HCH transport system substrate-binding protein
MANKFRLGLFFAVGSLVFVVIIIWLTGGFRDREEELYVCYFSWSVQGLNEGSSVMYNGVPVGRVENIDIAPDGRLVEVYLGIRRDFRMDSTIVATTQLTGITGLQVVNLSADTSGTIPPVVYGFDLDCTVIPVAEGAFQTVASTLTRVAEIIHEVDFGGISQQVEDLLQNVNTILDSDMVSNIEEAILRNSAHLDTLLTAYTTLGLNLNKLSLQLQDIAPLLVTEMDSLGQTLNDLSFEIRNFMQSMDEIIAEGTEAIQSLSLFFDIISNDPGQLLLPSTREGVWR